MSLARHMTRLLAVAIVMIVAGLGASAVQAHEGHPHRHEAKSAAAAPGPAAVTAVSGTASAALAGPAEREGCGLCRLACTACCHSVLMPASAALAPPPARPSRVAATQATIPPGLAAEALPRPPRPFA